MTADHFLVQFGALNRVGHDQIKFGAPVIFAKLIGHDTGRIVQIGHAEGVGISVGRLENEDLADHHCHRAAGIDHAKLLAGFHAVFCLTNSAKEEVQRFVRRNKRGPNRFDRSVDKGAADGFGGGLGLIL